MEGLAEWAKVVDYLAARYSRDRNYPSEFKLLFEKSTEKNVVLVAAGEHNGLHAISPAALCARAKHLL